MNDSAASSTLFDMPAPPCAELLGWRMVDNDIERGWVRIAFEGKDAFRNPAGFIQGGIQTAMLDDTLGPAVLIKSGGTLFTSTISLTANFLTPARPGPLYGEATVLQLGRTVAFIEGCLMDGDGQMHAYATANARVVPIAKLAG